VYVTAPGANAEDHPLIAALDAAHGRFGAPSDRDVTRWFDASVLTRYGIATVNYAHRRASSTVKERTSRSPARANRRGLCPRGTEICGVA
jgi:hypothetical protein